MVRSIKTKIKIKTKTKTKIKTTRDWKRIGKGLVLKVRASELELNVMRPRYVLLFMIEE